MLLRACFSLVYMPTSPDASFTYKFQDCGRIPEVYSYEFATENDIKVLSAAAVMFSGTPNPLPPASTPYDSGKHHHVQTGSTYNLDMETNIDVISTATAMFWAVQLSPTTLESMAPDFRKQRQLHTSCFGYCFYFRFVPDAVLRSRILSTPVEVDRAFSKTLPQPLISP